MITHLPAAPPCLVLGMHYIHVYIIYTIYIIYTLYIIYTIYTIYPIKLSSTKCTTRFGEIFAATSKMKSVAPEAVIGTKMTSRT